MTRGQNSGNLINSSESKNPFNPLYIHCSLLFKETKQLAPDSKPVYYWNAVPSIGGKFVGNYTKCIGMLAVKIS